MERAVGPSPRGELSRALGWWRQAAADRDLVTAWRTARAGLANVGGAALGRFRAPGWWCPCCATASPVFLSVPNRLRLSRHSVCPVCGSRSRHRGLALALADVVDPTAVARILHFAPEAPLATVLAERFPGAEVVTTDLHRTDVDRPGEDIQALGFADGEFDLVLCNHVLEHVPDDTAAMAELARVTRPGGTAVVSVPGDWDREDTVTFADTSLNGHHRDYGTEVADRLGEHFAAVEVVLLADLDVSGAPGRVGLRADDRLFVGRA